MSLPCDVCSVPYTSYPSFCHTETSIWWWVKIIKILNMEYSAVACNFFSPRSKYFPQYPIFLAVYSPLVCEMKLHTNSCACAHTQNMRRGSQHFPRPDQIFLILCNQYLSSYTKWSVPQEGAQVSCLIPHLCFHSLNQNCEAHYTSAFCDTHDTCGICLCNAVKVHRAKKNVINIMKLVQKSLNNLTHIFKIHCFMWKTISEGKRWELQRVIIVCLFWRTTRMYTMAMAMFCWRHPNPNIGTKWQNSLSILAATQGTSQGMHSMLLPQNSVSWRALILI